MIVKTLEEFDSEIEEYLLTLKARDGIKPAPESTKTKWRKVLKDIVLVLIQHGHETPTEKDYEEYRASITVSDETFKRYQEKAEEFFSWSKERRQAEMPEETKISEVSTENETVIDTEEAESEKEIAVDVEPSQIAQKAEAETLETESKESNAGRKRFDTLKGEKRSEKLMLYLTPSVIADVRDWCHIKGISAVNYITNLIVADMASRQDKLNSFRRLRDEA